MTFSIFTSCSLNYLPKARALAESVRNYHPDALLTLCLNDVAPDWFDPEAELFDQIWFPSDLGYERAWIFQHNVMELCTAVKGRALRRLLEDESAELQIYLDPDVYLFSSLQPIVSMMEGASIGLVPHILEPEKTEIGIEMTELSIAAHGVYNLGHLVVRNDRNGGSFAKWWADRLDKHCFDERSRGLFTDQRWVDLAPALFEGVKVLRTPSLDVATWNLAGRNIQQTRPGDHNSFIVNGEPLITYHFSGTGIIGTHRMVREIFDPGNAATAEIERYYEETIKRHGNDILSRLHSGFDVFDSGTLINQTARSLYKNHPDLQTAFQDPYADSENTFCYKNWFEIHHPDSKYEIRIDDAMMQKAYLDLFDESYYLDTYPSAKMEIEKGIYSSAMDHYDKIGYSMMMNPNSLFCTSFYLRYISSFCNDIHMYNRDVNKCNPLRHYLSLGLTAGCEPNEFFESFWYMKNNPDVCEAFKEHRISSPLAHFLMFGMAEGRAPGPNHSEYYSLDVCRAIIVNRSKDNV